MTDETYQQILYLEALRDELDDEHITRAEAVEIIEDAIKSLRKNG